MAHHVRLSLFQEHIFQNYILCRIIIEYNTDICFRIKKLLTEIEAEVDGQIDVGECGPLGFGIDSYKRKHTFNTRAALI